MANTTITRRQHGQTFSKPTTDTHVFALKPFEGYILEVDDVHFHHDSAVLLPDYGDAPDETRITAITILATAYDQAEKNPSQQMLDAGHADTTGADDYNLKLSVQRADSVLHALLGNRSGWVAVSQAKHKVEDYQQILKWAAWTYSWDCDPGAIDNVEGPKTKAAIKSFQQNYNAKFAASIAEDGAIGDQTWGAFFDVYMDNLKTVMGGADDEELAGARARIKLIAPKRVGCGENFPIEAPRQQNYRSQTNRRVELLFFEPDQVPQLDCHPGGDKCTPLLCEVYNPKMYKYTHILPPSVAPADFLYNLLNVKTPDHIAPGKESITIEYDISNTQGLITSGKIEIIRDKDKKVIKTLPLTPDQYADGHHAEFTWDGSVDKNDEFPDGFVTIEHSPFTVKVSVTGTRGDKTGTAPVKVELKTFKVELAPKDVLANDIDKGIYDLVGAIPAGSLVKLKLLSNIFTVDGATDEMTTQAAFTFYQTKWTDGPRIPLRAVTTVIDSKGNEVACGNALGRAKVLWDFTDPTQTLSTYLATPLAPPPSTNKSAGAKPYIDNALKYDLASARPKSGDNCHVDRGGKRASAAGTAIFQAADAGVQNFPFTLKAGSTRFWSAFADFQKSGDDDGRAGAVFRPCRMAGDNYSVTAYLDLTASLDTADDTPTGAAQQVKVGDFEVWREVDLIQHFKKGAQTTGAMPGVASFYADGYLEMTDRRGGVKDLTQAEYDTLFPAAFATAGGNALVRKYGLAPGSQWDAPVPAVSGPQPARAPTAWIATFLPFDQFQTAVSAGEHKAGAQLTQLLNTNGVGNSDDYNQAAQVLSKLTGDEMCRTKSDKDGITVLQFHGTTNLEDLLDTTLNGRAVSQTDEANRSRAGFLLCQTDAGTEQTPAHEMGHLLFLPHAPRLKTDGTTVNSGAGITPDFHDAQNMNCIMSYARPRPGFCGLCLLRLRGWKGDEFDRNGPKRAK